MLCATEVFDYSYFGFHVKQLSHGSVLIEFGILITCVALQFLKCFLKAKRRTTPALRRVRGGCRDIASGVVRKVEKRMKRVFVGNAILKPVVNKIAEPFITGVLSLVSSLVA